MPNPIKYTDLFDSGVQTGVNSLKEAIESTAGALDKMLDNAKAKGASLREALGAASPGNASGQAEIARLSKEVEELRAQVQRLTEARKQATQAARQATAVDRERIRAKEELRQKTREVTAEVRNEIASDKLSEESIKRLSNAANLQTMSYNELSNAYTQLVARANAMHARNQQEVADRQKIIQVAGQVRQEQIRLKEAMGNYTLSVGNYAKAFNGLDLAMQQIVRETPTIAMGARMYFMAISNNLPILTDQIKLYNERRQAELANIATMEQQMATMKAQGATTEQLAMQQAALDKARKESIPVGKALLQSLLSWQTLMILGITILTQYGDKIIDWVANLFSAENATRAWKEAQEELNQTFEEGEVSAAKNMAQADTLYKIATDNTRAVEDRIKAGQILQNQYEEYFGNLSTEQIMLGNAATAHDKLTESLMNQARARAYLDKITELYGRRVEAETRLDEARASYAEYSASYQSVYGADGSDVTVGNSYNAEAYARASGQLGARRNAVTAAEAGVAVIDDEIQKLRDKIPVDGLFAELFGGRGGGRNGMEKVVADVVAQIDNIRLIREAREAEINNIEDDTEREIELTRFKYEVELQDLRDYAVQQAAIMDTIKDLDAQRAQATTLEERNLLTEQMNDLRRQWNATEEGIEAVNKQILEKEKALDKEVTAIRKKHVAELVSDQENVLKLQLELADKRAENNKEGDELDRQKIQNQIEYYTQLLAMAIAFDDGSEEAALKIQILEEIVKSLFKTLDQQPSEESWFEKLFGKDSKLMRGYLRDLEKALKETANNIKDIISLYHDMAKAAVEAAEEQVSAAEKVYDAELAAYQNGYANNVEFARKELELRKKNLAEAEAEERKYAEMQKEVDAAMNLASMIRTSYNLAESASNLIKNESKWGVAGVAVAAAAITAMFGTFAAARIQARKLSSQQYGEGGTEYIDYGNSHASGHDVDFGTMPDGRPRRIERGETVAVINARSTGKYGYGAIAEIVDSINKGAFVEKYMGAFSGGDGEFTVNSHTNLDSPYFATMASDLKAIRRNAEESSTVLADGTTVIRYRNYTRRIRS